MNALSKFDKLVTKRGVPTHFRDAAVEINDTLELAWASAQTVFGDAATPEHAINLLPQFLRRADEKYQQAEDARGVGRDT